MNISTLAIVGAGTMGTGIAINAAQNGLSVTLMDTAAEAVARARGRAGDVFGRFVDKGRMSRADADAALARIVAGSGLDGAAGADLVIEAVFESFDIKAELYGRLSPIVRPDAVVATNTSALRVSDLARHVANPQRFLGLHYFSPAEINPVCEVVKGAETSDATFAAAQAFLKATRRVAIPCRDSYGFAVNRFFCPYTNEAGRLVDEGFATAEIDRVACDAVGAAAGPFLVMNLIKPRINLNAIRNLGALGAFYAPAAAMVRVGDAGESWTIDEAADRKDAARDRTIADRLLGGTFLPVLQELDEGVAEPKAIDTGAGLALKFGKAPCALMDALGRTEVERLIAPLAAKYGVAVPASLARVGGLVAG